MRYFSSVMNPRKIAAPAILILLIAIFVIHTLSLSFTQDDAFISYRYVKHFLAGNGLVYNPGERVEGYTNFLLIIIMSFFGSLGINYITVSKILGIASGAGILIVAWLWTRRFTAPSGNWAVQYGAPLLLIANGAFAYWAISGMETLLFSFLVFCGLYLASERNLIYAPVLALATLTRPEGALVFLVIIACNFLSRFQSSRRVLQAIILYTLLLVPHILFRLYYYHEFLPNPFYAKTGLSMDYLQAGLQYFRLFLTDYGFFGLFFLIPLAGYRFLDKRLRPALILLVVYTVYIILVGGDVLHGNRFFIPVLPIFYLLNAAIIARLSEKIIKNRTNTVSIIFLLIICGAGAGTYFIPKAKLNITRGAEIKLVNTMTFQAEFLRKARKGRFSIACSTIGALGYYSDADVIDMLGLTDSTIAKHPLLIGGIQTTWKEKNFNVSYLMNRRPDFVLFSTGIKPSSPAEKALFLSSRFRETYYPVFYVEHGTWWTFFRHKPGVTVNDCYYSDPEFVNLYTEAMNCYLNKDYNSAVQMARRSQAVAPDDFYLNYMLIGNIMMLQGNFDEGTKVLLQTIDISKGFSVSAYSELATYYRDRGDSAKAQFYLQKAIAKNRFD
mgnify:CR=1 FL=1